MSFESKYIPTAELTIGHVAGVNLPTPRCATEIYDEAVTNKDPGLQAAITKFVGQGVDVHVQLVQSMADEGYSTDNGYSYTNAIIDGCSWNTDNAVTIVVSSDPHFFDIALSGRQSDYKSSHQNTIDNLAQNFRANLRSGGEETYQDDAAKALDELYAHEYQAVATPTDNQPTPVIEQPPKAPEKPLDIPFAKIGGSGLALAVVGASVYRGVVGHGVKSIRTSFDKATEADKNLVTDTYIEATKNSSLTKILPKDDVPKLRKLEAAVVAGRDAWLARLELAKTSLKQTGRLWPDKYKARDIVSEYRSDDDAYINTLKQYAAELNDVQQQLADVDDLKVKAANEAVSTIELVGALKAPDQRLSVVRKDASSEAPKYYDVTNLEKKIADARAIIAEADDLRTKEFLEKPFALYGEALKSLQNIRDFVTELPKLHAKLIADAEAGKEAQVKRKATLTSLAKTAKSIQEEFDQSCWEESDTHLEKANKTDEAIDAKLADIGNPAEETDITKLLKDKEGLEKLAALEGTFAEAESAIKQHEKLLTGLRDCLPTEVGKLLSNQSEAETYIRQYAEDIEDPTEQVVYNLRAQMEALQEKVGKDKPAYLALDAERDKLAGALEEAAGKAKAERQEMTDLRSNIEALAADVKNMIHTAVQYEASHSDVDSETEQEIANLNLPEAPRERSRAALRASMRLFEQAKEHAESAYSDAESDVRREEEKRERIRQAELTRLAAIAAAERAEEARQEAARQASYNTSHTSFDFGGGTSHTGGGFGGGTSHSGGDF